MLSQSNIQKDLSKDSLKNNNGFKIKNIENSDANITYNGSWSLVTDSSASGGSYKEGTPTIVDSTDASFKYVGDPNIGDGSGDWDITNTSNSASTYAIGGNFGFSLGSSLTLAENNASAPNTYPNYRGSGWTHNNSSGSTTYSQSDSIANKTEYLYNDANITYNISGGTSWTVPASPDDYYKYNTHPTSPDTNSIDISFTGTNLEVFSVTGSDRGKVNLTVYDGSNNVVKTISNIDLYSSSTTTASVAKIRGLPNGTYRARIETTGTKNASSSGYSYNFTKSITYPSIEYNFNGSHIRFQTLKKSTGGKVDVIIDGNTSFESATLGIDLYASSDTISVVKEIWGLYGNSNSHRITIEGTGTSNAGNTSGQSMITLDSFRALPNVSGTFTGTSTDLFFYKHPAYGLANVWIDGSLQSFSGNDYLDFYQAGSANWTNVSITGLASGSHYFSLQAREAKNASSSNYYINFDALVPDPISASYAFSGTGIVYIATKKSDQGKVDIYIDDVLQGTYDLYSSTTKYKQQIFSKNNLSSGSHTIKLVAKNLKNASSSNYKINIDAFDLPKIVFTSARDGNSEIYSMDQDGSNQTNLTNNSSGDGYSNLSPDRTKVVFDTSRDGLIEIYVMNIDGSSQTRLTNNYSTKSSQPVWSPDGTKIVFLSGDGSGISDISVMNADGSSKVNLTNNNSGDVSPHWSPDSAKIVFNTTKDGNSEIYKIDANGSNQTRLTNNSSSDFFPVWSPDGTKIVFASDRDGNNEIYSMNADGSNQTRLTNNSGSDSVAEWSPDGTKIVFISDRDGNNEIYSMNADGSNQTRLTNNSAYEERLSFSPDGTKIVFTSDRDGNYEIYSMNADGSNQTRLTNNSSYDSISFWK